jgi:hypothetical protein
MAPEQSLFECDGHLSFPSKVFAFHDEIDLVLFGGRRSRIQARALYLIHSWLFITVRSNGTKTSHPVASLHK